MSLFESLLNLVAKCIKPHFSYPCLFASSSLGYFISASLPDYGINACKLIHFPKTGEVCLILLIYNNKSK